MPRFSEAERDPLPMEIEQAGIALDLTGEVFIIAPRESRCASDQERHKYFLSLQTIRLALATNQNYRGGF